jgi:hypothetical protein
MKSIKDLVKDQYVFFAFYRDGSLWYRIEGETWFFPVPVSDIGTATFNATEKAILMMRYIRKHLDALEKARDET